MSTKAPTHSPNFGPLGVPKMGKNQHGCKLCQDPPLKTCTKPLLVTAVLNKKKPTHSWHTPMRGGGGGSDNRHVGLID